MVYRSFKSVQSAAYLCFAVAICCWPCNSMAERGRVRSLAGLTITKVVAYDDGTLGEGSETFSLDLAQGKCGQVPNQTDESFSDTVLALSISNASISTLNVKRISIRVPRAGADGKRVRSRRLSPLGSGRVQPYQEGAKIYSLFLDVSGTQKVLAGTSSVLSSDLGIRNVTFLINGRTGTGKRFRKRIRSAFSFGDVDRCQD